MQWFAQHEAPFYLAGLLAAVWFSRRRGVAAWIVSGGLLIMWTVCMVASHDRAMERDLGVSMDGAYAAVLILTWAFTGKFWPMIVMVLAVMQIRAHIDYVDRTITGAQMEFARDALLAMQIAVAIVGPRAHDATRAVYRRLVPPLGRHARGAVGQGVGGSS